MNKKINREKESRDVIDLLENELKRREKLAGDLHDGIFQILTAINAKLSFMGGHLNELCENGPVSKEMKDDIEELQSIASVGVNKARNLLKRIRYPELSESLEIGEAIKTYIKKTAPLSQSTINLQVSGDTGLLTAFENENVFSSVIELINNALRHSEAGEINVCLRIIGKYLKASVTDNGKGFDSAKNNKVRGEGLSLVKNRIINLLGKIKIESRLGYTRIVLSVPLKKLNEN